jgi:hypothetical protein
LQNDINIPLTAISNHNGNINNEIRLIYVTDKETNLPIFFHYVAGNIIDNSTLKYIINTLKLYNINIKSIIIDAGYNSNDNLKYLYSLNIDFITRMQENRTEFKNIIKEHGEDIEDPKYLVEYRNKTVFCKRININSNDMNLYAYLCFDGDRKSSELNTYRKNYFKNPNNYDVNKEKFNSLAKFILVSNHNFETTEIMYNYYKRQQIEQSFDVAKNSAHILPLRVHSIETFRGHLLVSFIQTIILILLDQQLNKSKIDPLYVFSTMKDLDIDIYNKDDLVLHPLRKEEKAIVEELKLEVKYGIESSEFKNPYLKEISKYKTRGRPLGRKNTQQRKLEKISCDSRLTANDGDGSSEENCVEDESKKLESITKNAIPIKQRCRGCLKGVKNKSIKDDENSNNGNHGSLNTINAAKRRRGRPKGSKNKSLQEKKNSYKGNRGSSNSINPNKRGRGRPKSSKNK